MKRSMPSDTKPVTIDQLIAEHGDRIVHARFSMASDDVAAMLEIKVMDRYLSTLRYISVDRRWHLQAYTVDARSHEPRNDDAVHRVLDFARSLDLLTP